MTKMMELAQVRWACRRGMLELDLIFEPYIEGRYQEAEAEEQLLFQDLLACNDQELYDWLLRREAPREAKFKPMIDILLVHAKL